MLDLKISDQHMMKVARVQYYLAAASTAIAGGLHLTVAANVLASRTDLGIFFVIAGAAQLFFVVPMLRQWGRSWYYTGVIGTAILIIVWLGTRIPSGFSRPLPIETTGILVQIFQFAYLLSTIRILQTLATPTKEINRS
jgi:hypothetical protein